MCCKNVFKFTLVMNPTFFVCKLGSGPMVLSQESEVYEDYELFQAKVLSITTGYKAISAIVWRSALQRKCLDNQFVANHTPLYHQHICFKLRNTSSKQNLFIVFEKQMQNITFAFSETDDFINNWVCSKENGEWIVEKRIVVTRDKLSDQLLSIRVPLEMSYILATAVWTESRTLSYLQWIKSGGSHLVRKMVGKPSGAQDCFQGQYSLLDCNCQIFIQQFVSRLQLLEPQCEQ